MCALVVNANPFRAGLTARVWDMTEIAEMIEEAQIAAMAETVVPAAQAD